MSLMRLVTATAAVLVLGGWWWVTTAPPPSARVTALAPPSPAPVTATEPAAPPPHPAEILAFDVSQVEDLLPAREEVIGREAGVLTDAGAIDFSGTVAGDLRFVLEYACLGEGELEVEVVTPDGSAHHRRLGCDATLDSLEFSTGGIGYGVVRVVAHTTQFVGVAVQLASGDRVENLQPPPTSPPNQEEGAQTWPRSY